MTWEPYGGKWGFLKTPRAVKSAPIFKSWPANSTNFFGYFPFIMIFKLACKIFFNIKPTAEVSALLIIILNTGTNHCYQQCMFWVDPLPWAVYKDGSHNTRLAQGRFEPPILVSGRVVHPEIIPQKSLQSEQYLNLCMCLYLYSQSHEEQVNVYGRVDDGSMFAQITSQRFVFGIHFFEFWALHKVLNQLFRFLAGESKEFL